MRRCVRRDDLRIVWLRGVGLLQRIVDVDRRLRVLDGVQTMPPAARITESSDSMCGGSSPTCTKYRSAIGLGSYGMSTSRIGTTPSRAGFSTMRALGL